MLNFRQPSISPSDTNRKLREHVKAIRFKSGNELNELAISEKQKWKKKKRKRK